MPRLVTRLRRAIAYGALMCVATGGLAASSTRAQVQGAAKSSPVGTWHTISDVDGKPRGIIEVREEGGRLIGTERGSLRPEERGEKLCDLCPGARNGKPIIGMVILTGLRANGDEWTGGEILDPDTGKIYKAKIKLIDSGRKLVLRGFIGFSLIGRSQTWVRAN